MLQNIILGFAGVILIGAVLLMLPFATKVEGSISFVNALFTSVSATCVTGLIIGNTYSTFTTFFQIVILALIQFGGLGFLTITSSLFIFFGKKMTLTRRLSIAGDNGQSNMSVLKQLIKTILLCTVIIEGVGSVLLTIGFLKYYSFSSALYRGIFHSISAFCNAGFDIIDIGVGGVMALSSDSYILLVLSALIVLGGLGFIVVGEIVGKRHFAKFSTHTKVVLIMSGILILLGTLLTLAFEFNNSQTIGNMSFFDKLVNSIFQSVTTRTAGFNSIDCKSLTPAGKFVSMILMFIGASPASTGGGIKTTTLFVLLCAMVALLKQRKNTVVNKQAIGHNTVAKACAVLFLAILVMVGSMLALLAFEPDIPFESLFFEQISAYATVGLSVGVSESVGTAAKLVLIFNMFLGRVGAISFFVIFNRADKESSSISYSESNIII